MRSQTRRYGFAAGAVTVALGGAAIGGVVARAQVAVPTVTITLKEFKVASSTKLVAGKVTLVVVNKGKLPHALRIAGPGVAAKTPMLAAGKSARLSVTLKDGTTTLWCPVGNHASLGMKMLATLGTSGGPATPPAPTTTTGGGEGGYTY